MRHHLEFGHLTDTTHARETDMMPDDPFRRPGRPGFFPGDPFQTSEPPVPSRAAHALTPITFTPFEDDRLLALRLVMLHGRLDAERATEACSRLMTLDALGEGPIMLHLRTPDAELQAAFSVVDTMDVLRCQVHVLAVGEVGGPALAILASGGRREMTKHAVLHLNEPRQRFDGTAAELAIREREHRRLVDALYERLAETTGRSVEEIRDDAQRDRMFTATQALAYGLVHDVAGSAPPGLS
jgi:ATP-dependent Clp protease protease subunit